MNNPNRDQRTVQPGFFGWSTGAVIWMLISEVFPNRIRGKGQALGSFTHWFFSALITFFSSFYQYCPGNRAIDWVFSLMMLVQALLVWNISLKPKGKSLEMPGEKLSAFGKEV
jgi:MFS transporter, SP family, arabinose:H+ symporter